jgi:NADPH-dependent glutamate synthase beta subunit-like oxidoreductase
MGDFGAFPPDMLSLRVKSVAVIGAGPSGLAAARLVAPYATVVLG